MRAAMFQMTSGTDPAANAAAIVEMVARAKGEGADMLFTPEMAGYLDRDRKRAAATLRSEAEDAVLARVRDAAARAGLWVHLGSLPLKGERADGRWANRSLMIDDSGAIRARYDKIHLFDVDVPGSVESHRESAHTVPGRQPRVVDTPMGRLGLSVCYDMRFPELFRVMSRQGAEMFVVPSAFTVPTGRAHWESLLRSRAIENLCGLIAPAQWGMHANGRETFGDSMIIDHWGKVLARMPGGTGCVVADIDAASRIDARARFPVLEHRV
ncbi:MAG: carbon-nitrogen hydrolase family protein, partial [Sphingobium sp.]